METCDEEYTASHCYSCGLVSFVCVANPLRCPLTEKRFHRIISGQARFLFLGARSYAAAVSENGQGLEKAVTISPPGVIFVCAGHSIDGLTFAATAAGDLYQIPEIAHNGVIDVERHSARHTSERSG